MTASGETFTGIRGIRGTSERQAYCAWLDCVRITAWVSSCGVWERPTYCRSLLLSHVAEDCSLIRLQHSGENDKDTSPCLRVWSRRRPRKGRIRKKLQLPDRHGPLGPLLSTQIDLFFPVWHFPIPILFPKQEHIECYGDTVDGLYNMVQEKTKSLILQVSEKTTPVTTFLKYIQYVCINK